MVIFRRAFQETAVACVSLIACFCTAASAGEKAVHVRGTEVLVPMAQYMAETYMRDHPGSTIVVNGGGTFKGYKSLLDGTADIAMVSSSEQENVNNLFSKDSPHLAKTVVGYTAIVPVVHPNNPLQNISLERLRDVFSGSIKNWKQLGGQDAAIVILIGRQPMDSPRPGSKGCSENFTPSVPRVWSPVPMTAFGMWRGTPMPSASFHLETSMQG
jgi:ABC-type phosphate transport system substrate-binding protein